VLTPGSYAAVNGLRLYYEIHGRGEPLLLLHGGVGAIEMFGEVLPLLAEGRQVIAVDLQAHGRTADIDRPLSFESMADDIGALIEYLGFTRADLMGSSLGGGVALQTVIRHPAVVGWIRNVQCQARRHARHDALHDLLFAPAGVHRDPLPQRADGQVTGHQRPDGIPTTFGVRSTPCAQFPSLAPVASMR
jgi:pimeloyl-ACP methyl ester carboxylesterase